MKSKRKLTLVALVFVIAGSVLHAQQNPDPAVWEKEYTGSVSQQLSRRRAELTRLDQELQTTNPDYVVYVPKVKPEVLGDCYNDHFEVFSKPDGTLFALCCQATCEGYLDAHVTFFRSVDQGKTWSEPKVLAGPACVDKSVPIATYGFPMVSKSGRIYVLYTQFVPGKVANIRQHTGLMMGIYSDDNGDTWSEPQQVSMPRSCYDADDPSIPSSWVVWQKPLRLGSDHKYFVGVTRYVAPKYYSKFSTISEFIQFENIDDDPQPSDIKASWFATNDDALRVGAHCEEPSIVKLPDNRLFALMRTSNRSPFWSVSSDGGKTWTKPEPLRDRDGGSLIFHPLSPCPIYDRYEGDCGSGFYFTFVHREADEDPKSVYGKRGPLDLLAGKFQPDAHQPIWFAKPQPFVSRPAEQSFYCSTTVVDGKTVLWYPDTKFFLLGRVIGDEWFQAWEKSE
ncbi:MAG: sialidase family protein [Planctomycetia bacterium]|nr:sialidase family protein [Planctomycetia bacterium]